MIINGADIVEITVSAHEGTGDESHTTQGGMIKCNIKNITENRITLELWCSSSDLPNLTWKITDNSPSYQRAEIIKRLRDGDEWNVFIAGFRGQQNIDAEVSSTNWDNGIHSLQVLYRGQRIADVIAETGKVAYYEIDDKAASIGQVNDLIKYAMNASKLPSAGGSGTIDFAANDDIQSLINSLVWRGTYAG